MPITSMETDDLRRFLQIVMETVERLDKRVALLEDVTGHRSIRKQEDHDAAEERRQARLEGL